MKIPAQLMQIEAVQPAISANVAPFIPNNEMSWADDAKTTTSEAMLPRIMMRSARTATRRLLRKPAAPSSTELSMSGSMIDECDATSLP